jgi:hypothetical protein
METNITDFQKRAAAIGLAQLFNGKRFDVCALRELAKILGREQAIGGSDEAALRLMHCVDYADMGPDLARMTREKCLELLGLPPQTIEEIRPAEVAKPATAPAAAAPRLAWWRK